MFRLCRVEGCLGPRVFQGLSRVQGFRIQGFLGSRFLRVQGCLRFRVV